MTRREDGTIDFVTDLSANAASINLTGVDLIASYSMEMEGGSLGIDYLGTVTNTNDFEAFAGSALIECAGNFGVNCGEPIPEYKHRTTVKWTADDYTVQLLWRYVGEVDDDDLDTDYFVDKIDGTSYFEASGTYYISDSYRVTVGIDNLLNEDPPVIGDNDEQANTYPATYDVFGRTYYAKFTASF